MITEIIEDWFILFIFIKFNVEYAGKWYVSLSLCKYASSIPLTSLPIVFSGFKGDVDDFIKQYDIRNILSVQKVSDNPTFDKFIIKATLVKNELQQIVNDLTISDFYPTLSVKGSVGLGPNKYISSEEGKSNFNRI